MVGVLSIYLVVIKLYKLKLPLCFAKFFIITILKAKCRQIPVYDTKSIFGLQVFGI